MSTLCIREGSFRRGEVHSRTLCKGERVHLKTVCIEEGAVEDTLYKMGAFDETLYNIRYN